MRKLAIAALLFVGAYFTAWWKVSVAGPRMIRETGERMVAGVDEIRRYTDELRERTDLTMEDKVAMAQAHAATVFQAR